MSHKTFCDRCGDEMGHGVVEPNVPTGNGIVRNICESCLIGITGWILCTFKENTIKGTLPCDECEGRGFVYAPKEVVAK